MALRLLSSSCFLTAAASGLMSAQLLRADDVLAKPYASVMASSTALALSRRQEGGTGSDSSTDGIELMPDGTLNLTAWDADTDAACVSMLRSLPRSSNPSGNCICYNLPALDATNGVFEAELRLYRVSEPRGQFEGINQSDIKVSVAYHGASASSVSEDSLKGSGMVGNVSEISARSELVVRADSDPELLQAYMLVGQIDKSEMSDNMSMAALQALVMPTLTLSATNATGGLVNTNVTLNEASFLNGVFSRQTVQSDFSAAQAAVDDQVAALRNGTVAFVLPGVQLMIFPIGLIITSIWLAVGLAAYGMGTFERVQYAEMYKQRQAFDGPKKTF